MANYANVSMVLRGPYEGRKRLAAAFRSMVEEAVGGEHDGELFAHLDDGAWGTPPRTT